MVKFKTRKKDCKIFVKVKISSDEKICERELNVFSQKQMRGFLKPTLIKKQTLEYTGPIGISIAERLKRPFSKYEFFFVMEQIVDTTSKLKRNGLFINKLILDKRYVFINEITKEVQFVYLPIEKNHICVDIIEFMESIIYSIVPEPNQNSDYISQFIYFIKGLPSYDEDAIEKYIIKADRSVVNSIKKHTGSGFITDKPKDYYDHYETKKDKIEPSGLMAEDDLPTGRLDEEEATGLLTDENEATGLLVDDDLTTDILDDEGTALLDENEGNMEEANWPKIERVQSDEIISINKSVFRIGKERSCVDFFVSNNNAISRSHADIITREQRYYVTDLNSKNHTYINGKIVPINCEIEIFNGDKLKFANEEFIFWT
ncbi:MAG: FHA domain-containing protein [Oscillospiraceae bacterium]